MGNPYEDASPSCIEVVDGDIPTIKFLDSDCKGEIQETAAFSSRRCLKSPPDHVRYWKEKVGTYLRNELGLRPDLRESRV